MSLTTSYSLWLLPLCIALGVLCAWLLYRRTTEQHGWSKPLQWVLGTARALVIAFNLVFGAVVGLVMARFVVLPALADGVSEQALQAP